MSKEIIALNVEGMSCSHCEKSIINAVGILNGVDSVTVDLLGKKVMVEYDMEKVSVETIKDTIEDQGYEVK